MNRRPHSGFTLIELLAVILLIAVVVTFTIPAVTQISKGTQMSAGSQMLSDTLAYARQLALTRNHSIEVRFYKFADPNTPGEKADDPASGKWRAIQLFDILDNGAALPVREMTRLPNGVVMHPKEYSTLLDEGFRPHLDASKDATAPEIPLEVNGKKIGRNYWISSFRFQPDGSTDLPPSTTSNTGSSGSSTSGDRWYATIVGLNDETKPIKEVNFYTVQVDSVSGTLRSFRPNVR